MLEGHQIQLSISFQNLSKNLNLLIGKRVSPYFAIFTRQSRPGETDELSQNILPAALRTMCTHVDVSVPVLRYMMAQCCDRFTCVCAMPLPPLPIMSHMEHAYSAWHCPGCHFFFLLPHHSYSNACHHIQAYSHSFCTYGLCNIDSYA